MRQSYTREGRRPGSVTPDETGLAIGKVAVVQWTTLRSRSNDRVGRREQSPIEMPVMANDCTPHRSPSEERRLLIRSVKSHKALLSPKVTKAFTEKINLWSA